MKSVVLILIFLFPLTTYALERDANGRIHRSRTEVARFKRMHPCPSTGQPYGRCPGYIIDHINPLACGGPDAVRNMQWQAKREAKIKDRWERKTCAATGR